MIVIHVVGLPATAGSKTPGQTKDGRLFVRDSVGKSGKVWRKNVQVMALQVYREKPLTGALRASFAFVIQRPARQRGAHGLRPDAPAHHITRPDLLKLTRAAEDALTGIVYGDDGQIIQEQLSKRYAEDGDHPGVTITVEKISC